MLIQSLATAPVVAWAEDGGEGASDCQNPTEQQDDETDDEQDSEDDGSQDGKEPEPEPPPASTDPDQGEMGSGEQAVGDPAGTDGDGNDGGGSGGGGDGGAGGGNWFEEFSTVGDPIDVRLGDKRHVQVDYISRGAAPLRWTRVYHSNLLAYPAALSLPMGSNWRGFYDRSVQTLSGTGVRLHRASGAVLDYNLVAGVWVSPMPGGLLSKLAVGWQYTNHRDVIETYDASGRLISMSQHGRATSLQYDGAGRLIRVSNPFGRALAFAYDASNRLSTVTLPGGGTLGYAYDAANRLIGVRYADNAVRQYTYENGSFPNALTGVIDESGKRRLTWGYDGAGRPNYGHYGSGSNAVSIVYSGDTVTTTDVRGTQRVRGFGVAGGRRVLRSLQTSATSDGPATAWGIDYDAAGQVARVSRPTGEVQASNADSRGRLVSGTRAAGTGIALGIQHTWHPTFRIPTQSVSVGVTTNRTVDAAGRILQITQTGIGGSTRTVSQRSYNAQQLLASVTDARGATTSYGYDAAGNLTARTNQLGQTTSFANHDAHGRPTRITRPDGTVITRSYDARGRLASKTVAGVTTAFSYDAANRLLRTTHPDGSWRERAYDSAGYLSSVTNHRGESIVVSRDVDGKETGRATYTASGLLAQKSSRQFDKRGRLASWLDSRGQATRVSYAGDGRMSAVTDPLGRSRSLTLDLLDRTTAVTLPNTTAMRNAGGAATVTTTNSFHPSSGRHVNTTDTVSVATSYSHDGFHRSVADTGSDAGNRTWTRTAAGDVSTATDPRGITTTISRDALGRITGLAPSGGTLTSISYVAGRKDALPAAVSDSAGNTAWTYDSVGRLLSKTQTVAGISRSLNLTRDATGRVTRMVYPSGMAVDYAYNADQISSVTVAGTVVASSISYLPHSNTATGWRWASGANYSRSFDADGRVTQVTLGPVTRNYGFDAAGRITNMTDAGGAAAGTTGITYDEAGQITGYSGPLGNYGYAYDSNGNRRSYVFNGVTYVNGYAPGTNRLTSSPNGNYTFDAAGNPTYDGYYNLQYDAYGRMTAFSATNDYLVLRKFNAQGLRLSNVVSQYYETGVLNSAPGGPAASKQQSAVDTTDVARPVQGIAAPPPADGLAQRTALHQLMQGEASAKPARGPLLAPLHAAMLRAHPSAAGKQAVVLSAAKSAVTGQSAAVTSAAGQWVVQDSRQFFYDDSGHILGEYALIGGSPTQETVWFNGQPVAAVIGGVVYQVSADHLGTPRSLVRASSGVEAWHWDGEPFGNSYPTINAVEYSPRFAGQLYDAATGFHYNWNRDYSAWTGRYLQPDPIGLSGGLSRFAYVGGNPVSSIDPMGLAQCDVDDMTALARATNPDMNIPNPSMEVIRDALGLTNNVAGYVNTWPWSTPVINSKIYGGTLSVAQRGDLYNTIVHESWHYDQQSFYNRDSALSETEAKAQANARTAKNRSKIDGAKNSCGCGK